MSNLSLFFVVDQMRVADTLQHADFWRSVPHQLDFAASIVELGYIPAVTPVGHATISAGEYPNNHGILGRGWKTGCQSSPEFDIEELVGTFEQIGGAAGLASSSTASAHLGSLPAAFSKILDNNICAKFNVHTFTLVAAAKDFVSILLGGTRADVLIYPWLINDDVVPGQFSQCAIKIYCSPRLFTPPRTGAKAFSGWVGPRLAAKIIDVIVDLLEKVRINGKPLDDIADIRKRVIDRGWIDRNGCHTFAFPFSGEILREPDNNVLIDKFYSSILRFFVEEHQSEFGDIAVIQSLFSADLTAHDHGVSAQGDYQTVLRNLLRHIADTTTYYYNSKYNQYRDLNVCITSDHGGRHVDRETHLIKTPGTGSLYLGICPVPLADSACSWYFEDFLAIYRPHPAPVGGTSAAQRAPALVDRETSLDYWFVPQAVLDRSFVSDIPELIIAPESNRVFIRPAGKGRFGTAGAHGAGVKYMQLEDVDDTNSHPLAPDGMMHAAVTFFGSVPPCQVGWQLTPEEQFVPLLIATTKTINDLESIVRSCKMLKDVAETFSDIVRS